MRSLKHKIDVYFDLDENPSGQFVYYGTLAIVFFIVFLTTFAGLIAK